MESKAKTMTKFNPGDRVARNDKPGETYLVTHAGLGQVQLENLFGVFNESGFHLAPELDKKQMDRDTRIESLYKMMDSQRIFWLEKGEFWMPKEETPEERDLNEDKAKEFERIIRKREFDKRVKELKKPSGVAETYWDGEHLANAIEKTVSTAMTPQAMWRLG